MDLQKSLALHFLLSILSCLPDSALSGGSVGGVTSTTLQTLTTLLDATSYDRFLAPTTDNRSTNVTVNIYLQSVSALNTATMDYLMDFYLRLRWRDHRLEHAHSGALVTPDIQLFARMWSPDVYFANAKEAALQTVTMPNFALHVHPNGTVWTSRRITAKLICNMDLEQFPQDQQTCYMKMLPYLSTKNILELSWSNGSQSVSLDESIELPDFRITSVHSDICSGVYDVGVYSCLLVRVELQRYAGFYICKIFIPSVAVVSVSWVTFWISPRMAPARITLSITTFLALFTQFSKSAPSLPTVSYATSLDIWITICTVFVYAAIIEFAFAYQFAELEDKNSAKILTNGVQVVASSANGTLPPPVAKQERWSAVSIDRSCRIIFPLSFLFCVVVYWIVYRPHRGW